MVVPALLALMDDFQSPRVQAHACAALVNFAGDGCSRACVLPCSRCCCVSLDVCHLLMDSLVLLWLLPQLLPPPQRHVTKTRCSPTWTASSASCWRCCSAGGATCRRARSPPSPRWPTRQRWVGGRGCGWGVGGGAGGRAGRWTGGRGGSALPANSGCRALTALLWSALRSRAVQEAFIKYYDACMPLLTNILTHASGAWLADRTSGFGPSLPGVLQLDVAASLFPASHPHAGPPPPPPSPAPPAPQQARSCTCCVPKRSSACRWWAWRWARSASGELGKAYLRVALVSTLLACAQGFASHHRCPPASPHLALPCLPAFLQR